MDLWMDGRTGRHKETDGQIDMVGMMMEKKPGEQNQTCHLSFKHTLDSWQYCQVFMPLGIVKLSPLVIIHSADKYVLFKIPANIPA